MFSKTVRALILLTEKQVPSVTEEINYKECRGSFVGIVRLAICGLESRKGDCMRNSSFSKVLAVGVTIVLFGYLGCKQEEGTMEKTGRQMDESMEKASEKMQEVGETTSRAVEEGAATVVEETEQGLNAAGEEIQDAGRALEEMTETEAEPEASPEMQVEGSVEVTP